MCGAGLGTALQARGAGGSPCSRSPCCPNVPSPKVPKNAPSLPSWQALAVQQPTWLPYLSESSPHVTVSVAEGVPAKEAGELVAAARAGSRARIVPLVGLKLLHGRAGGALGCSTGWG